ncbi:MAG: hypothetical protein JXR95_11180 [Deltaproteobacteria bacterium]|nr:hypothetical protein [Deltaproteobacteria bacterium]
MFYDFIKRLTHLWNLSFFIILSVLLSIISGGCDNTSSSSNNYTPDSGSDVDAQDISDSDIVEDDFTCSESSTELPRFIDLPGADPNGIYDPDLEWDPVNKILWMVYSTVDGLPGSGKVSTHLSFSEDNGTTWCHAGIINQSTDVPYDEQPADIAQEQAHWSHETPSIYYDVDAPPQYRWTIIWHRYLHVEDNNADTDDRHFEHGWIARKSAPSPWELADATEEKLFSYLAYHFNPVIEAYNNSAPGGLPLKRFDTDPNLGGCIALGEPGVAVTDGKIIIALFCYRSEEQQDIVLINYSHESELWSYSGTLLTTEDAQAIHPALTGFNAPDIYKTQTTWRMVISPADGLYHGCIEYEIDLENAVLSDNDDNGPDVFYVYEQNPDSQVFQTGACTYHSESLTGMIAGDIYLSGVQFRLVATGDFR